MKSCTLFAAHDLRIVEQTDDVAPLAPGEVRIRARVGGICGSDLHYFHEGRVGDFAVVEPLTLGHEVAGEVVATGEGVDMAVGTHVAVNPSLPCNQCDFCLRGANNHCRHMRFFGSAALQPHVQGVFKEELRVPESQCVPVPRDMDFSLAAMGEPLAVALHAVQVASPVTGRHVLITGAGPIGCLVLLAARHAGAATVTMVDIAEAPLRKAAELGAERVVNLAEEPQALAEWQAGRGHFDVAIECSGSIAAIDNAIGATRAGGTLVQVGFPPTGPQAVSINKILVKEISFRGSFRFHEEFNWAIDFLARGHIDVRPLMTASFPVDDAVAAFHAASDRNHHMKVHLELS